MISIKHTGMGDKDFCNDLEFLHEASLKSGAQLQQDLQKRICFQLHHQGSMQLEVSDGIGNAKMLINHEVISELHLYQKTITLNTVLVIRGQISRYSAEDGQTSFILNEVPRLVLN